MRFILGLLSLLAFVAVLIIALIFVIEPPAEPILAVLVLAVFIGLAVFFRALRSRTA